MLDEQPLVFKVVSILVGLSASLFVFKQSSKGDELFNFLNSVVLEAKKVVWPYKKRDGTDDFGCFCCCCSDGDLSSIC